MTEKAIIFMDGEFIGLRADGTHFLSIALVKPSGEELYLELESEGEADGWVKENVLPHLTGNKVSKQEAVKKIREFVGENKPYLVSYMTSFDWVGLCGLFGVFDVPFFWIPIDFGTILFSKGIDLRNLGAPAESLRALAKQYNIDTSTFREHHALGDARLLKLLYEKVFGF